MPTNTQMERCISSERGALVFWSPEVQQRKPGSKVQIIDVFSLQVVTGYTRDPQGRLLLESQPSVAAGRSWFPGQRQATEPVQPTSPGVEQLYCCHCWFDVGRPAHWRACALLFGFIG